ncbi:hypothetical protein ABKS89_23760 [Pseudomonas sp. LABIM340]|uniref:hypothetical protein n=1 Tax=Pseudomonas sp. LABIM340 TaxID=3156585 RepID=UPI0032AE9973
MNKVVFCIKAGVLAAVLISGLAGCATATIGERFPANNVALLRVGLSTTEEARGLLGEPQQVVINPSGQQVYIWQYVRSDASSGFASMNVKTTQQQAALIFSPEGRLLGVQQLINVPPPIMASSTPVAPAAPTAASAPQGQPSVQEQLDELNRTPLSYEEYQRRYRAITGQ